MIEEHNPEVGNKFGYDKSPQLLVAAESVGQHDCRRIVGPDDVDVVAAAGCHHADCRCLNTSSALSAWDSKPNSLAITSSTVRSVSITKVVRLTGMNLPSRPRLTPNWVATVPSVSESSG